MHEIDFGFDLEDTLFTDVEMRFSGGGQGSNKRPPTKIVGSQDRARREKVRNIPKPQPRPLPKSKP